MLLFRNTSRDEHEEEIFMGVLIEIVKQFLVIDKKLKALVLYLLLTIALSVFFLFTGATVRSLDTIEIVIGLSTWVAFGFGVLLFAEYNIRTIKAGKEEKETEREKEKEEKNEEKARAYYESLKEKKRNTYSYGKWKIEVKKVKSIWIAYLKNGEEVVGRKDL